MKTWIWCLRSLWFSLPSLLQNTGTEVKKTAPAGLCCAQAALRNSAALRSPVCLQWLSAISARQIIPHCTNLCNDSGLEITIHQLTRLISLVTEAWLKIPGSSRRTPSPAFLLLPVARPQCTGCSTGTGLPLCPHAVHVLPLMTFPKGFTMHVDLVCFTNVKRVLYWI